jgi:hypothetical protein
MRAGNPPVVALMRGGRGGRHGGTTPTPYNYWYIVSRELP